MRRISLIVAICLLAVVSAWGSDGVRYSSALLGQVSQALGLNIQSMPKNTEKRYKANNTIITVRGDELGVVEHIGVPVFPTAVKQRQYAPIYDYIEFALLNYKFHVSDKFFNNGDIVFRTGGWDTLLGADIATAGVTMQTSDSHCYCRVTWNLGERVLAELDVRMHYDRVGRATLEEMEARLWQRLAAYREHESTPQTPKLEKSGIKGVLQTHSGWFQIPETRGTTYYNHRGHLLCSDHYPAQSLCNMLLSPASSLPSKRLVLEQRYGTAKVEIPLRRLVQYCLHEGMRLYAGVKEVKDGRITATLYAVDNGLSCFHMFSISANVADTERHDAVIEASAQLFIPMDK